MQLTKYKITAVKHSGYMVVTYHENNFKSILNEFNPPLEENQLNWILKLIPNDPQKIEGMFIAKSGGKIMVELVKGIGAEPEQQAAPDYPVNEKIALWCRLYAEFVKDPAGNAIKYKTGAAESGKLKALPITPVEFEFLLGIYFKSDAWFTMPKSISNFINKYNEIRAMAYAKPVEKKKNFPLPFDAVYFGNLSTMDQRAYWDHLRVNGYKFISVAGRGGKWEKVFNTDKAQ